MMLSKGVRAFSLRRLNALKTVSSPSLRPDNSLPSSKIRLHGNRASLLSRRRLPQSDGLMESSDDGASRSRITLGAAD